MGKTVAVIAALDTKAEEFAFLKKEIEKHGCKAFFFNVGVLEKPHFTPDVSAEEIALAGGRPLSELIAEKDRGIALDVMTAGIAKVVRKYYEKGSFDGIISMGGGGGTAMGTSGMRALPVGFPKVMVSTVASGDTAPYVGTSDITMMPSIVDVSGLNRITRMIFSNAAAAICGMVTAEKVVDDGKKKVIAASMFGNTTRAVDHARSLLEKEGYEVLVFHATGTGGKTMEKLIGDGIFDGVLDMTTTEWADEVCGGALSAGPDRLDAAGKAGIPQIITPACIDMCNFWAPETIPAKYNGRIFYHWNPNVTLMRTNVEENAQMGKIFAQKINAAKGPVAVLIPMGGFSEVDLPGKPFWWPEADQAFVDALKKDLRADIPLIIDEHDVNAPAFSELTAKTLLSLMHK